MRTSYKGWVYGFIGVLIFSGSLPATKIGVSAFDPLFLTIFRALIAACVAGIVIMMIKPKWPKKSDLFSLVIVALGVVIGFPLLTALALEHNTSAHSIVFLVLLPLMTAIFGVWRGRERPKWSFWIFSLMGSSLVVGYALLVGSDSSLVGNIYMLLAIIVCGLGYAEGAVLAKRLGNWQVISWALLLSLPFSLIVSVLYFPDSWQGISIEAYFSLFYVSLFSMYIGFIFWYKGLAEGGIASVGQLQLLQPFFGLILSSVLLNEEVGLVLFVVNVGVIACVAAAKRVAR